MHKAPQVSPAGLCVCVGRTQCGKVCKNWGLFAFPRGGRWPAGPDEGRVHGSSLYTGSICKIDPHQSVDGATDSFPLRGEAMRAKGCIFTF